MGVFNQVLQVILSLSILVIIHELGHFIPAKIFKTRVEKFYLFFNWKFSLFKYKPKKENGTEFGIGWIPLGGYVKISGMIDESMDKEQLKKPPQPWEFRAKPAWQRLIMMIGGVTMNVILAIVIYISMLWAWGEEYLPNKNVEYGIVADSLGRVMGLQDGDHILAVNGEEIESFYQITGKIVLENAETITVLRSGKKLELNIPEGFIAKLIELETPRFINPRVPFIVSDFGKESPAKEAGIKTGDRLIGIDSISLPFYHEYKNALAVLKGEVHKFKILRNTDTLSIPIDISEDGIIGVYTKTPVDLFEWKTIDYSFFEAIPAGIKKTFESLNNYIKQFKLIFSPETKAYKSVGSFILIGSLFPKEWNWAIFWNFTAFLSLMLAFINILPIPALDGGHTLFLLYEMITRRKPSEKFMEIAQMVGMILIFALIILAIGNDILRFVF